MSRTYAWLGLSAAVLASVWPATGTAQLHRATDPVALPPSALVHPDDAMAIDVNPAEVGFLPTWSATYLHSEISDDPSWLPTGDAAHFATPLFFGLAGGLSLQSVRAGGNAAGIDHGMATLALAFAPSRRFSFGTNVHWLTSSDPRIDALASWDFGMSWRASEWLGMSLVGRDLLATRSASGFQALGLGPSFVLGSRLRPLGDASWIVSTDLALDDAGRVGGRLGSKVRVPYVGTLSALAEVEELGERDALLRLMAGLTVQWGQLSVGGGAFGGEDAFEQTSGWYAMARVEGQRRPGLPVGGVVRDLEVSGGTDARGLLRVVMELDRARHEEDVAGVLLRMRGGGMGMAYAQELRLMIESLRRAGKPVICYLEQPGQAEYYACAAATQAWMDPAGMLRLMGPSTRIVLLGEALRDAGIHAEFYRIGAFKSAPEQLTNSELSEPARLQRQALLDQVYRRLVLDLARDLEREPRQVETLIDQGPYLAAAAAREGLVAARLDEQRIERPVSRLAGGAPVQKGVAQSRTSTWGASPGVGVVVVDGTIVDGESVDVPFLDVHLSGGRTVAQAIDRFAADPRIGAIVLRVDSPGGAVMASDQIWRAVRRAREQKPVIASMGAVAASGGYYVACGADEIWADPSTLTGSIGVFFGKLDIQTLAKRLGIHSEGMARGKHAGADTVWRPFTPSERAALVEHVRQYYRMFLERVAVGRDMPMEQIDRLGRGRVWSGDAALERGLVDRRGGFGAALARARRLAGLPADARVVIRPERKEQLLDYVFDEPAALAEAFAGREAAGRSGGAKLPWALQQALEMAVAFPHLDGGAPLAMMPYRMRP